MSNPIFSTIINPPLAFGVTSSFLFLLITLFFSSVTFVNNIFGLWGMIIGIVLTIMFWVYGKNKTSKDPYWLNIAVMSFLFEKKAPIRFIRRIFSKKDKVFYR